MIINWTRRVGFSPVAHVGDAIVTRDRYQLIADRARWMEPDLLAYIHERLEELNEHDYSLRASYYVRRDRWTWLFKGIWKFMCALEDLEIRFLVNMLDTEGKGEAGKMIEWRDLR
jgi:hypothetical protein|tara:strand:- start:1292 stop:1636 length:345 start_codon:yes stop_codon:yes gene_type:complete